MRKYVGIRPAEMYIVTRKYAVMNLRPMSSRRERTYAISALTATPSTVERSVRTTELMAAVSIRSFLKTVS